jgi:hypothetical protein
MRTYLNNKVKKKHKTKQNKKLTCGSHGRALSSNLVLRRKTKGRKKISFVKASKIDFSLIFAYFQKSIQID